MSSEQLNLAIRQIKSGQKSDAQAILLELLQTEPENEAAWFWLVEAQFTTADRISVLRECLANNPGSSKARAALDYFERGAGNPRPSAPFTIRVEEDPSADSTHPASMINSPPVLETAKENNKILSSNKSTLIPPRRSGENNLGWIILGGILILVIILAAVFLLLTFSTR